MKISKEMTLSFYVSFTTRMILLSDMIGIIICVDIGRSLGSGRLAQPYVKHTYTSRIQDVSRGFFKRLLCQHRGDRIMFFFSRA